MKLYFYFLEEQKEKPHIRIEECEVVEKPKSYTLLGKVPGFYNSRVLKPDIGLHSEYGWKQYVVLTEPNVESVKKLFSDYLNGQIQGKQKEIEELKEKLIAVENMEEKQ